MIAHLAIEWKCKTQLLSTDAGFCIGIILSEFQLISSRQVAIFVSSTNSPFSWDKAYLRSLAFKRAES